MPKFNSLRHLPSLRRLRTVFGPSSSTASTTTSYTSRSPSSASSYTHTPGFDVNFPETAPDLLTCIVDDMRSFRSRGNGNQLAQLDLESKIFAHKLVAVMEPRVDFGASLDGFEEVLRGQM